MDFTHIHLLINHLPIVGSILGAIVLFQGIWSRSSQTKIAAYTLFLLSALGGGIAYLTGEPAEETVENIQGIADSMIERHEDLALISLVLLLTLGVASIVGLYIEYKKSLFARNYAIGVLLLSIMSFAMVGWTGYVGGQIRHTEITSPTTASTQSNQEEGEESD